MIHPDAVSFDICYRCLQKSPLFKGLDEKKIEEMLLSFRLETWPRNSPAMDFRKTQKWFYVLLSGRLKVFQSNPDSGREQTIFILGPGDAFDMICLLDGQEHEIYTESLDELKVVSARIEVVRDWVVSHPEFNRTFLPYLGNQLRQLEELASDLSLYDTESRLMRLILRHVDRDRSDNLLTLINDLSHEELANLIGSVRAVVNRHIQNLKGAGILITRRRQMSINNFQALLERVEKKLGLR